MTSSKTSGELVQAGKSIHRGFRLAAPARSLSSQQYAAQVRVLEINTFYTNCAAPLFNLQKNKL